MQTFQKLLAHATLTQVDVSNLANLITSINSHIKTLEEFVLELKEISTELTCVNSQDSLSLNLILNQLTSLIAQEL